MQTENTLDPTHMLLPGSPLLPLLQKVFDGGPEGYTISNAPHNFATIGRLCFLTELGLIHFTSPSSTDPALTFIHPHHAPKGA